MSVSRMEYGSCSASFGAIPSLCGKGILSAPRMVPLNVSFTTKSDSLKLDLHSGLGSLHALQLFASKKLCFGCSPCKRPILRNSNHSSPRSSLCIPRKHGDASRCYCSTQYKLNRLYSDVKLQSQHNLSSRVVVKSELNGSGTSDAAYALEELNLGSKVRGICFYAVTAFVAIFSFVLMLIAHPFVLLLDQYRRKAQHFIAKIWAILTVSPFFKIKVEGLENLPPPDTPAVYVSNHQSFLDIYTLLTLGRPFNFISKTSIFLFPIIGWAMFLLGVIPLKRMDSRSQLDCLKRCMDLLKKGASVFFFPEGTRSKDGKLGAFKKGAFSVAAKIKVPVVPITLIGTGKLMPAGMEGILNLGSVKVVIHKPIEGSDPDVLGNETKTIIADALNHEG
ncbi:1-acyl-sn-glycerol-3-phosphate acyltransferase BAT2, chloroplastic isoform X2 [Ziziphus jujuba]|nr:1-acyl-sn-glycerol-3-phosphate acyltransferase BAT2, chloroplastic isoform X2 [Ziziphus jujuba]XP_048330912.2 1-acyl-sn-glycerol-3-phosphate acyltransferase BAT2, chloroplastic isoform X2 [Ziziphus jujuba]XP_060672467.1 1-acyl-sn-glycerol-3-phosphate acyltransferase BAT2, chloroplastic isoform X2 [Ziziphus jujuba]